MLSSNYTSNSGAEGPPGKEKKALGSVITFWNCLDKVDRNMSETKYIAGIGASKSHFYTKLWPKNLPGVAKSGFWGVLLSQVFGGSFYTIGWKCRFHDITNFSLKSQQNIQSLTFFDSAIQDVFGKVHHLIGPLLFAWRAFSTTVPGCPVSTISFEV